MCSPSAPSVPTSTSQTTIPEYAQPTAERLVGRAEALSEAEYVPFTGQRLEGQTQEQKDITARILDQQAPDQFQTGTNLAGTAGLQALQAGRFQPGVFKAPLTEAQQLQQFQLRGPQDVSGLQLSTPKMQTAQTRYQPQLTAFQIEQQERFGNRQAQEYMSPFMQNVVDIQQRRAIEDSQKSQLGANLGAVRQGTYGGARQTLAQTERERGLREQLGDIQGRGLEAAFGQAQQQFERDRAAKLQAQQANLQAQLGVQQLGTQTGLQAALANLSAAQQANVQNQAAQLQTQGLSAEQALRAALANQQAGLTVEQQNLQARLGVQQLGAQQSLEAQRANQQAVMEAQKLQEQSRQFGGELGVRGSQAATQAGATLGQLGIGQQQAFGQLSQLQASAAAQQQAIRQRELDLAYQDFISQQQMPFKQLGFLSDVLRGSASLAATGGRTVYEQQQSPLSSIVGPGLAALGAYREFGR